MAELQTPETIQINYDAEYHQPNSYEDRSIWKDITLEFFGTLLFVYVSLAGVNQVVLSESSSQLHVALCFALGLTSGIVVAGKSGGHLNPAVSLVAYMSSSDFGFCRLIGYIVAQVCGGFVAGLIVLTVYYSWINNFPESDAFIGSFGTLKNPNNSLFSSIIDQFIGSALLMFGIVVTPTTSYKPLVIGTVLGGLGLFQGSNGFAFNLARDFGPRLASSIVFGSDAFSAADYWFWVPMVVPFFGVAFGFIVARGFELIR